MDELLQALLESIAAQGPMVALLVLILIGGIRKVWVWGWLHEELKKDLAAEREERYKNEQRLRDDRDYWRKLAVEGTALAEGWAHRGEPQ